MEEKWNRKAQVNYVHCRSGKKNATYKPGDMSWTAMSQTNAENAGGMHKPGSMLSWSVYMARIKDGGEGHGGRWMRRSSGGRE